MSDTEPKRDEATAGLSPTEAKAAQARMAAAAFIQSAHEGTSSESSDSSDAASHSAPLTESEVIERARAKARAQAAARLKAEAELDASSSTAAVQDAATVNEAAAAYAAAAIPGAVVLSAPTVASAAEDSMPAAVPAEAVTSAMPAAVPAEAVTAAEAMEEVAPVPAATDAGVAETAAYMPTTPPADATAAMPEAMAATTPLNPAPAPVAGEPDNPTYGTVEAAQPRGKRKGVRIAIIVALIIVLLAVLGVIGYLFTQGTFSETPDVTAENTQRVALSDARVIEAFDEASMEAPDITQYAYVSQDTLIGPKYSDIVLNEPTNLGAIGNQIVECTATATATFKNKGIEITVPVTLPFEYSDAGETWVPGDITRGEASATPLASPSATEILANLDEILTTNDPTYGEQMAGAEIMKTTSDLTIDGGSIGVELSKTLETEENGVTHTELRTSSVTLAVAWSPIEGWVVSVSDAGQIKTNANETTAEGDAASGSATAALDPAAGAEAEPINVGTANYGDSIQLSGTLQAVQNAANLAKANNYTGEAGITDNADGNVQFALVLDRPLDITLNGTAYRLTSVAIATNGLSDGTINDLYGKTGTVTGSIEQAYATSWTPVGLKTLEIKDIPRN